MHLWPDTSFPRLTASMFSTHVKLVLYQNIQLYGNSNLEITTWCIANNTSSACNVGMKDSVMSLLLLTHTDIGCCGPSGYGFVTKRSALCSCWEKDAGAALQMSLSAISITFTVLGMQSKSVQGTQWRNHLICIFNQSFPNFSAPPSLIESPSFP